MNRKFFDARAGIIASTAIFGTIGLFVRTIPLPSAETALYRAVMAAILIAAFILFKGEKIKLSQIRGELWLLAISGFAMGFNWILLFEAYNYTTVSSATLSYYFAPIIVTVVCPILFKEKMTIKQWVCFIMSTIGIFIITGSDTSAATNHVLGVALGLGAASLYATVIIINKLIKKTDGIRRTLVQFVFAIVILLPYEALTNGFNLGLLDCKGALCLLAVGIVHTGLAYCMYFSALSDLPGQKVAILSYIDPLVAVLLSVFLLGEEITAFQMLGGGLVLGFTLWNELS